MSAGRKGRDRAMPGPGRLPPWWPLAFGLVLLAGGLALWEPFPPGIWHDDGVYVLLARSLAQGEGLRYVGVVGSPLAPKFPPLFPALLAGLWKLWPSFPENVLLLGGVNIVLLSAAGALFAAYLQRGLGLSSLFSLGAASLAWLSPALWRTGLVPLSEPLFLLLLVASIWAGALMEVRREWRWVLLFLVAAGGSYYARSLGIAVLVGGVGSLLLARRRVSLWLAVGGVLVVLPWLLWTRWAAPSIPAVLQDTLGPYGGWLLGQAREDPGGFLLYTLGNAVHLLARFLSLHLPGVVGPLTWLGLPLACFCGVGLLLLGRRTPVLALTVLLSLGILLVWPFQDVRLLVPLHPFLVLGTLVGFAHLLRRLSSRPGLRLALGVLGAAWIVLDLSVSTVRLASGWPSEPYRIRAEALGEAVRAVAEKTPTDAVVGAPELWSGIHLYTGRIVTPSAPFRPLDPGGQAWGSPREQYRLWIDTGVSHLLVEHGGRVHGEALDRVDEICPPGTVQVLDLRPGQFLVRLAWDAGCQGRVLGTE